MSLLAHQVLQAKHAYVAALLAGVTAFAAAQSSAPAAPASAPQAPHHHEMHHGEDMRAHFVEKMLARFKEKLKITPEQESAWITFTAAMKPPEHKEPARPDFAALEKMTTPERLDKMHEMRVQRQTERAAFAVKREDALKALYAVLNPEQKKTFDEASLRMMRARHWKHEHRHHGWGHEGDWHQHEG